MKAAGLGIFTGRRGLMRLAVALVAAVVGLCWLTGAFDPRYEGHSASWWLDQVNRGEAEDMSASLTAAFRGMGPPGIRYLGRTLASRNILCLNFVEERRAAAALMLYDLGPDAAPALRSLVRLFRHPQFSWEASCAAGCIMAQLAPDKLEFLTPELIADLKAPHPDDARLLADIQLLNAIGPKAKSAIPALWPIARNGDWQTRRAATVALWNIGRVTNALTECLSNSLSDHGNKAGSLLFAFRSCVPLPNAIAPLLEQALRRPEPSVRRDAEFLLEKTDPERLRRIEEKLNRRQDELLQDHLKLRQSTNRLDRFNAPRALPFFGPKAAAAAPRLVDILVGLDHGLSLADDKSAAFWTLKSLGSNQYGGWAADLLGDIGPPARKALPELEKNLKSRMSLSEIALAISKIDPEEAKRLGLPGLLIICPDKY